MFTFLRYYEMYISKKYLVKQAFNLLEIVSFLLPVLPSKLNHRLFVAFVYFGLHHYKAQIIYAKFKTNCILA